MTLWCPLRLDRNNPLHQHPHPHHHFRRAAFVNSWPAPLDQSEEQYPDIFSSRPSFLPPAAAPFASSVCVAKLDRHATFLTEDVERHYGTMYRDNDPVLGWRWRAYPQGTHEAAMQRLREKREGKRPVVQGEPEPHSPAAHDCLPPSPPPSVPVVVRSRPPPPPSPPRLVPAVPSPLLAPALLPVSAVVELAPLPSSGISFAEQFATKCAATAFDPLPFPRFPFLEEYKRFCAATIHLPLPFPLPPPAVVAPVASIPPAPVALPPVPAPLPAPMASMPPPIVDFAATQQTTPTPTPLPAPAKVSMPPPPVAASAAQQQSAPAPPPAPLPPSGPVPMERQNMWLDDDSLLALDIATMGMSLDALYSWTTGLFPRHKDGVEAEAALKLDPFVMAFRYNRLVSSFKRTTLILRLQVQHARTTQRQINKQLLVNIWHMLSQGKQAFKIMDDEMRKTDSDIFPDFNKFAGALRFFSKVGQDLDAELSTFALAQLTNSRAWRTIKKLAAELNESCEDYKRRSKAAAR